MQKTLENLFNLLNQIEQIASSIKRKHFI